MACLPIEMEDFSYKTRTQGAIGSERMQLLSIIAHYWDELERYEIEGGTQRQKWDLWEMIANEFNNHPSVSVIRTPLQVKTLFKNMKTKARKYRQRIEESKTTGVIIETDPISETVLKLNKYQSRESLNAILEPLNSLYYLSRKSVLNESERPNNTIVPGFASAISSPHSTLTTAEDPSASFEEDTKNPCPTGNSCVVNESSSSFLSSSNHESQMSAKEEFLHKGSTSLSDSGEPSQVHTFGDISVTALPSAENKSSSYRSKLLSISAAIGRNRLISDRNLSASEDPMSIEPSRCTKKATPTLQRVSPLKRPLTALLENNSPVQELRKSSCTANHHNSGSKLGSGGWHCCCSEFHKEMISMELKEHEMRMALLAEEILCQRAQRSLHEEERRAREQSALFRKEEREDALNEHRTRMKIIELECKAVQSRIHNAESSGSKSNKWLLMNGSKEI